MRTIFSSNLAGIKVRKFSTLSDLSITTTNGWDGIYADDALLYLENITISGDGGIGIHYRGNYQLSADNINVQNFTRGFDFYNANNFDHVITNSQITNNGDGIYINYGSSVSIADNDISGNNHGIYITGYGNSLTLTDSDIYNNSTESLVFTLG